MKTYRVSYTYEIDAPSPLNAVLGVRELMTDDNADMEEKWEVTDVSSEAWATVYIQVTNFGQDAPS